MKIVRALLAVALLAAPAVVVRAEAAQPRYRVLELVRLKAGGPTAIEILVRTRSDDDRAMVAVVPLRRAAAGDRWEVPALIVSEEGPRSVVRAYGTPAPECPLPQGCVGGDGESVFVAALSVRPAFRNFVVSDYATTTAEVSKAAAPYWRFRPARLGVRRVLAEQAGTGVRYLGAGAERFTGASATGGRHGSLAFAAAPCASIAVGSARLDGGTEARTVCDDTDATFTVARRATTWRFRGDVTGVPGLTTRLLVVDFPKP